MDCSEINLKLTKDNFNPQTLANYITKHKDTILANYSEKYLDCLDVTLDITDQTITNPRSQRSPRFQSGGGIGEQRGENKRILFTLN